jgi:hypothetical protein
MNVFISYRRHDALFLAALIRDRLIDRMTGGEVFLDVDNIPVGVDFAEHIRSWVTRADVVVALIGTRWQTELLRDRTDFVRLELLCAHRSDRMIVPVLHSGREMPRADELPDDLAWLPTLSAFTIGPQPNHIADLHRLIEVVLRIEDELEAPSRSSGPRGGDTATVPPRQGSLDFISESDHRRAIRRRISQIMGR